MSKVEAGEEGREMVDDLDDGALRNGEQGLLELSPVDIESDVDLFPGSP